MFSSNFVPKSMKALLLTAGQGGCCWLHHHSSQSAVFGPSLLLPVRLSPGCFCRKCDGSDLCNKNTPENPPRLLHLTQTPASLSSAPTVSVTCRLSQDRLN